MRYLFLLLAAFLSITCSGTAQDTAPPDPNGTQAARQEAKSPASPAPQKKLDDALYTDENLEDNPFMQEFFHMLLVLGAIIAGMLFIAWLFKRSMSTRMEQMNVSSAVKILEKRNITPRSAIYLIEVHEHRIVVGETQSGMTLLADIPTTGQTKAKSRFQDYMQEEEPSSSI